MSALIAIAVSLLLAIAAGARLTQSDGDLFAHIALGRTVLAHGTAPHASSLGLAAGNAPVAAPAWGAAALFAILHAHGGLAMIAAFTAVLAGVIHGALAGFMQRRGATPIVTLLASMIGFVLVSTHWLARPHLFSLCGSACLLLMLESRRPWMVWLVPHLFVLWANLHGGWVFGLIVLVAYTVGVYIESLEDRTAAPTAEGASMHTIPTLAIVCACSILATFATPYGFRLHDTIARTLASATVRGVINEYAPPSFNRVGDLFFFAILVLSLLLTMRSRRRLPRRWLLVILVAAAAALQAGRNIALFGVTGWPLIAAHLAPDVSSWLHRRQLWMAFNAPRASRGLGRWTALASLALLGLGANGGRIGSVTLIQDTVMPNVFPVDAVRVLRLTDSRERLLTTWEWSGYVPYAWPGRQTWFDPLSFTDSTVMSYGTMLRARGEWRAELERRGITLVLVPRELPLADSLRALASWELTHADSTALVLRRLVTR